jgi:predicted TPR repeat methyltransferase
MQKRIPTISRNDSCSCGSGLKYGVCCMAIVQENNTAMSNDFLAVINKIPMSISEFDLSIPENIQLDSNSIGAIFEQGVAAWESNDLEMASISFRQVLKLDSKNSAALNNLGAVYRRQFKTREAIECFEKAIYVNSNQVNAFFNLAACLCSIGNKFAALTAYEAVLLLEPGNATAKHMISALSGENTETMPETYVQDLFDDFAENYDEVMVNRLNYSVPDLLQNLLIQSNILGSNEKFANALDFGCGTGLSGKALEGHIEHLTGVDLSAPMIEIARSKQCYDELMVAEAMSYLSTTNCKFDLIIAADTLIYFGDLTQVFEGFSNSMPLDAVLLISIETTDADTYQVQTSGRFAHSPNYIEALALENGFKIEDSEVVQVRNEMGKPIAGATYLLKLVTK